jgi:hypothetical protein
MAYPVINPFVSLLSKTAFLPLRIPLWNEMLAEMITQVLDDGAAFR